MSWTDWILPWYGAGKWAYEKGKELTEPGHANDDTRGNLSESGNQASNFADLGQQGFANFGAQGQQSIDQLRDLASGKNSVSAEQLRQGLQQNLSAQRSMAASASPTNLGMAARTAAVQGGRAASGLAGQQAVAGLQERQNAQMALSQMIAQMRQQELQAALQSRGNAINAYGGAINPKGDQSTLDQWAPVINMGIAGAGAYAKSDRRAKIDIVDADDDAKKTLEGLKAYSYRYKDEKDGKGKQFGIMAQDLEKAGLKHAVVTTSTGKYVDGAKLSTSNTALIAALGKRLSKLEAER